jgi:pilus assembly protein Flp/PilA
VQQVTIRDWAELIRIQLKREEGQTMAEYGLLIALIAILLIGSITLMKNGLSNTFSQIAGAL